MIHELCEWDPDREAVVEQWALRDIFQAVVERRKQVAWREYHEAFMRWAALAPHAKKPGKPPELPDILKGK